MTAKRALICGVSGQDGAYLAKLLLGKGYEVWGASRDAQARHFTGLIRLEIHEQVHLVSMILTDFRSVLQALERVKPDEIYNLAGQTSVGLSFEQPVETLESIALGTLNLLEAIRFVGRQIRIYNASSSDSFGDTGTEPADENTPFRPRSPYAVAKAAAFWELANYREAYGLWACSGILFNHESPLRPPRFVTSKIVTAATRIANGSTETLYLGDLSVERDWGWAPEYVDAMWRMLQQPAPDDFVIATGETVRLEAFIDTVFRGVNLDWRDHVRSDKSLHRPTEIQCGRANPAKARIVLGWQARWRVPEIVRAMLDAEQTTATTR